MTRSAPVTTVSQAVPPVGAGGLVRAYASSASAAIRAAGIVVKTLHCALRIDVDYAWFGKLEYALPRLGLALEQTAFTDRVAITIHVPIDRVDTVTAWILDCTAGQAIVATGATLYKA